MYTIIDLTRHLLSFLTMVYVYTLSVALLMSIHLHVDIEDFAVNKGQ